MNRNSGQLYPSPLADASRCALIDAPLLAFIVFRHSHNLPVHVDATLSGCDPNASIKCAVSKCAAWPMSPTLNVRVALFFTLQIGSLRPGLAIALATLRSNLDWTAPRFDRRGSAAR